MLRATALPPVVLLDLDDTIVHFTVGRPNFWLQAFATHHRPGLPSPERLTQAVDAVSGPYWADAKRASERRLALRQARREVAELAFTALGLEDRSLAHRVADDFTDNKEDAVAPFEGAIEALTALQGRGTRLGLITNGHPRLQRRKLKRYDLERHFEAVLIEGEWGVGKPHASIFAEALSQMRCKPEDAWMVGDNLVADIAGAQALGITAVWVDHAGDGPPAASKPDRIIRALSDLLEP
ncbi:MAG: HAD family hydrolase [Myxococcales bacterium]|nr:HAD family hydrolase [Myxococcales bacterium]